MPLPWCVVPRVCISANHVLKIGGGPVDFPPGPLGQHQPACKPGSVDEGEAPSRDGHSSATPVARRLEQPTRTAGSGHRSRGSLAASLAPSLFGLAPGGVCRAACVAASAVRSYRTVSPLPRRPHPTLPRLRGREREGAGRGGLFSVALSLGSPPPDVIRHRMSMEPGLSSPAPPYPRESGAERRAGAAVRPTDDSRNGVWRRLRQAPRKRFRLAILAALALHRAHPENLS